MPAGMEDPQYDYGNICDDPFWAQFLPECQSGPGTPGPQWGGGGGGGGIPYDPPPPPPPPYDPPGTGGGPIDIPWTPNPKVDFPSPPGGVPSGSGGSQGGSGGGHMGNNAGPGESLKQLLNQLMAAMNGSGFPQYEGDLTAGLTPDQMKIYESFFAPGGGFSTSQKALSDIAQQDSLGRAQLMMQPAMDRAVTDTNRNSLERQNLGNNVLSTGGQGQTDRAVGGVRNNFMNQLASMIPQLDATRIGAAQGLTQNTVAGMGIGDILRTSQQADLNAKYNEYLRTTGMGGPLQALLQLLGGGGGGGNPGGQNAQNGASLGQSILGLLTSLGGGQLGSSILNNIASNPNWYLGTQRGNDPQLNSQGGYGNTAYGPGF